MYRFFETLLVQDGEPKYLTYHNRRLNRTIKECLGIDSDIDLEVFVKAPDEKTWRCRVSYSKKVEKIEWFPYKQRLFRSFKLISANISYPYKSDDRSAIDALFAKRGNNDDIIILKGGLVSDTSIANIALYEKEKWITPSEPLLKGTTRERLLEEGVIFEGVVTGAMIKSAKKIALMNALIGFCEINNPIFEE